MAQDGSWPSEIQRLPSQPRTGCNSTPPPSLESPEQGNSKHRICQEIQWKEENTKYDVNKAQDLHSTYAAGVID